MTINIISDIHADYDREAGKVIYNAAYDFTAAEVCAAVRALNEEFVVNAASWKKLKFDNSSMNELFDMPHIVDIEQLADWLSRLDKEMHNACLGMNRDNVFVWSRVLLAVERFFRMNSICWNHNYVEVDDIRKFMFKYVFDFDPSKLQPADYLIIAGDIGYADTYDLILNDIKTQTAGKFKKILHIAGNHDHWLYRLKKTDEWPTSPDYSHEYCEHEDGDYVFLGCTMWTPLGSSCMINNCVRCMNDYRYIPGFKWDTGIQQYKIQTEWLRTKLAKNIGKKVIVFTHHQPFKELVEDDNKHNGYDGSRDVSGAYAVLDDSLNDIVANKDIKLWACGHTHMNFDGILHGVHVVRNPIGYRDHYGWMYSPPENFSSKTWYDKIIEV